MTDLCNLDSSEFIRSEKIVYDALSLFEEMLHSLLKSYINRTLSITQQFFHLIKCAYLLCALYLKHGISFMSNQLYDDLQCMIKNTIFYIAKTQELNSELCIFICLLSNNVLKALFGHVHMIDGHSPNVDISEIATCIHSTLNLDDIFSRHLTWEQKPNHLKLVRSQDVDHLHPDDWEEHLVAKTCDIRKTWKISEQDTAAVLLCHSIEITTDFTSLFTTEGCDLM